MPIPSPTATSIPTATPAPTNLPPPKIVPGPALAYGDLTQGISGGGYTFFGKAGDVPFVRVTRGTLGSFERVLVLDPNNKSIAGYYNTPSDLVTLMPALSLTGRHTIVVSGYGEGTYALTLRNVAGGLGNPIAFGDSLVAEIRPSGDVDMYSFNRKTLGIAFIRVARGTFSGRIDVQVFDPKGKSITDVYALSDQVILSSPLSQEGTYNIIVGGDGKGTGTYTITLQGVGFK